MKVLLVISDYAGGFPFIQDLESELKNAGLEVDVLEFSQFTYRENGKDQRYASKLFSRLAKFRKLGTLVTIFTVKSKLKELRGKYDAVNIHSCEHIYYYLAKPMRKLTDNISVMIWGSDFYRVSNSIREKNRRIFDQMRFIAFGNPQNAKDFTGYYNNYADKSVIAGFGSKKFDLIKNLMKRNPAEIRKQFGLPEDKIIISCGYNGREMQQHLLMLEQVGLLSPQLKSKIFLVLQLGYGADPAYVQNLKDKLGEIRVPYKMFDKMLSDEEIAALRIVPDITLNAQVSDGFSSSIQEHLLARNILIVGDWLPYAFLEKKGMFLRRVPVKDFSVVIEDVIQNLSSYKEKVAGNTEIIESISGWPTRVNEWKKVYTGDVKEIAFRNFT
jgi:hypothetical protein